MVAHAGARLQGRLKVANINACTVDNFDLVLSSMIDHIFPVHAYREQKHYMRYNLKKTTSVYR